MILYHNECAIINIMRIAILHYDCVMAIFIKMIFTNCYNYSILCCY